jgi:hypothetical protein
MKVDFVRSALCLVVIALELEVTIVLTAMMDFICMMGSVLETVLLHTSWIMINSLVNVMIFNVLIVIECDDFCDKCVVTGEITTCIKCSVVEDTEMTTMYFLDMNGICTLDCDDGYFEN